MQEREIIVMLTMPAVCVCYEFGCDQSLQQRGENSEILIQRGTYESQRATSVPRLETRNSQTKPERFQFSLIHLITLRLVSLKCNTESTGCADYHSLLKTKIIFICRRDALGVELSLIKISLA